MQILLKTEQLPWLYLLIVISLSTLKTLRAPTKYNFYNEKTFCFISFQYFFYNPDASAQFERGYADLVDELLPSVVSIATSQTVERQTRQLPELPEGPSFQ